MWRAARIWSNINKQEGYSCQRQASLPLLTDLAIWISFSKEINLISALLIPDVFALSLIFSPPAWPHGRLLKGNTGDHYLACGFWLNSPCQQLWGQNFTLWGRTLISTTWVLSQKKHLYALNSGWHVLPLDGLACTLWEKNLLTFQHISQIYLKCISISIWVWVLFGCFGFWGRGVGVVFFGGFVFCFFYSHW